jgi:hypothetical protein
MIYLFAFLSEEKEAASSGGLGVQIVDEEKEKKERVEKEKKDREAKEEEEKAMEVITKKSLGVLLTVSGDGRIAAWRRGKEKCVVNESI